MRTTGTLQDALGTAFKRAGTVNEIEQR
jgi:hypothetical protein